MITLITGDNSYEIHQAVHSLLDGFVGEYQQIDGSELELRSLPDLLMGMSLFSTKRLIIIKHLSENKTLWTNLVDWLPRLSADVSLVLVEPKPDKRTNTYKELKKVATIQEYVLWSDRDTHSAEAWAIEEAKKQGFVLDKSSVRILIERTGLDQWQIFHALEKLALIGTVTPARIEQLIDAHISENVFSLFETALKGDTRTVIDILKTLELSEDPYRLFALLSGQAFQLAAVTSAMPSDNVSKDFAIHPYVTSKLSTIAKQRGKVGAKKIVEAFAKSDDDMKISKADPWILIEQALLKIAELSK